MKILFSSILFITVLLLLPGKARCQEETNTYTNPLLDYGPDPWAVYIDGYYYYMNTMGDKLVLWKTKDVTDLKNAEQKVIWTPSDPAYSKDVWAPEIHYLNKNWYVYFAADDGNTDNHQMYCLENTSKDPMKGSFKMKGRIQTDLDNNWAIDGSVFENHGELYFVWSGWEKRRVDIETQCIYIAKMKNPWTLESQRVQISRPVLEWERKYINVDGSTLDHIVYVNEGPQPLISPDGSLIHIVYSASGCWTPYYKLGCLTAPANSNLLDASSWTKSSKPLFAQSPENGVYGTGHNSFFRSPDGTQDFILYHARDTQMDPIGKGDTRNPRCQQFTWTREGYPVFGVPEPRTKKLDKPSGIK